MINKVKSSYSYQAKSLLFDVFEIVCLTETAMLLAQLCFIWYQSLTPIKIK